MKSGGKGKKEETKEGKKTIIIIITIIIPIPKSTMNLHMLHF